MVSRDLKYSKLYPGNYENICVECGDHFVSDKRNPICDDCRQNAGDKAGGLVEEVVFTLKKQTSPEISSLAARVLSGYDPTRAEVRRLAASCLSQDEGGRANTPKLPLIAEAREARVQYDSGPDEDDGA